MAIKNFGERKAVTFSICKKTNLILSSSQLSLSISGQKRRFFASKCHIMVGNRQTHIFLKKMKTLNALDAFPYPKCFERTISDDFMII